VASRIPNARLVTRTAAILLIGGLLVFTAIYRNCTAFSPASATRSWSLSIQDRAVPADHDLAALPVAHLFEACLPPAAVIDQVDHILPPAQRISLNVSPPHRPPPLLFV
jgi:hypothetical protein